MSVFASVTCNKCSHKNYFIRMSECPACGQEYKMSDMKRDERFAPKMCPVCGVNHSILQQCKYDTLVSLIHTLRRDRGTLVAAHRDAVRIAQSFQKIIKDFEPNYTALMNEGVELCNMIKKIPVMKDDAETIRRAVERFEKFIGVDKNDEVSPTEGR